LTVLELRWARSTTVPSETCAGSSAGAAASATIKSKALRELCFVFT
jgi:hypothetical protein